ncbi:MAG: hypothetical protein M4579_005625 [Chaenotheca gracillima]|nr:MAG: hypothetical protein M4579_005625 [Chaenotheca gracillima]
MQVRGVPDGDRAIGPDGSILPFARYTLEDLRKLPEETGPFGKPRRRGLSRSKTATPARKEDPSLDGFAEALAFDTRRQRQEEEERRVSSAQQHAASVAKQDAQLAGTEGHAVSAGPSALMPHKEPTEVILYGFKPSQQYAAIDKYERISLGRICEDYARDPPIETRKYQTISSYPVVKPLTREERRKAMNYAGGNCWIKITFDTAEAAHRALAASPHRVNAHWVYAELYHGMGPKEDKEIPVQYSSSDPDGLQAPRYPLQSSRLLSSSVSAPNLSFPASARGPSINSGAYEAIAELPLSSEAPDRSSPQSSTTASSATATGSAPAPTYVDEVASLRSRPAASSTTANTSAVQNSEFCTRIPTARRAILRPAEEALLPSRTTSQWLASYLPPGLLSGPIISEVPRFEDGTFDYNKASLYWKIWYWFDRLFYLDTLGLND